MNLHFVTNRAHSGSDRWKPDGYTKQPSGDGAHNLRYGHVELDLSGVQGQINETIKNPTDGGDGNGSAIANIINGIDASKRKIFAYQESSDGTRKGSTESFDKLQELMRSSKDVVVFIHGYNTDWWEAVSTAAALEIMLNANGGKEVAVVLFSWPSDGEILLVTPYFSDRHDASLSRFATIRALLILQKRLADIRISALGTEYRTRREYLKAVDSRAIDANKGLCGSGLHLVCHSMGNYVLECALGLADEDPEYVLSDRMFDNVILAAPDVNTDALEPGRPLSRLASIAKNVSVYFNKEDMPLLTSMATKNARERLGRTGAARPEAIDRTFHQIDCTGVVEDGIVEHSYFLNGKPLDDIRRTIHGVRQSDPSRPRQGDKMYPNVWRLVNYNTTP